MIINLLLFYFIQIIRDKAHVVKWSDELLKSNEQKFYKNVWNSLKIGNGLF